MTQALKHHNFQVFAFTQQNASTPEASTALKESFKRHGITGEMQIGTNYGLCTKDPFSQILMQLESPMTPEAIETTHKAILEVFPDATRASAEDFVVILVTEVKPENFA